MQRRPGSRERTLRRQFEQHLGASPKQGGADAPPAAFAKRLLTETRLPITDVAFAAGFASIRRFNDAWLQAYGMTPAPCASRKGTGEAAPQSSLQLHLLYRPPFDVQAMLAFYRLRAIPGLERVDEHGYERRHRVGEQEGLIRIEPVEGRGSDSRCGICRRVRCRTYCTACAACGISTPT